MYLILLLLVGIPLLYMEMIIGQWLRKNNIQAQKQQAPWLSSLGYSSTLQKWFSFFLSFFLFFFLVFRDRVYLWLWSLSRH